MERIDVWMKSYEKNLAKAIEKHPEDYWYPVTEATYVAKKMKKAFCKKTYNKDSFAIKWTCKELGVPFTYSGINEYIGECSIDEE